MQEQRQLRTQCDRDPARTAHQNVMGNAPEITQALPKRYFGMLQHPRQHIPHFFAAPGVAQGLPVAVADDLPERIATSCQRRERQKDSLQADAPFAQEEGLDEHVPLIGNDVDIPIIAGLQQAQTQGIRRDGQGLPPPRRKIGQFHRRRIGIQQAHRRADGPNVAVIADRRLPEALMPLRVVGEQRRQGRKMPRMPDHIGIHGRHQDAIDVVAVILDQLAPGPAHRPGDIGGFSGYLSPYPTGMDGEIKMGEVRPEFALQTLTFGDRRFLSRFHRQDDGHRWFRFCLLRQLGQGMPQNGQGFAVIGDQHEVMDRFPGQ